MTSMFWYNLEKFDGSDLVPWLDDATRRRIVTFFQEIRDKERVASLRGQQRYRDYLNSPLWRKISRRVLERDEHVCRCCTGTATQVHHRSYAEDVMRGENDEELASVCDGCHNYIEFDELGNERDPEETDRLLLAGRRDADYPAPKVDLRRSFPQKPLGWDRMSVVQRSLWHAEYERLRWRRLGWA